MGEAARQTVDDGWELDDVEARFHNRLHNPLDAPVYRCRQFFHRANCQDGPHSIGKILVCAREWCPTCGQKGSEAHKRRYARLIPRVQQMGSLGMFTITWPLEVRDQLRKLRALTGVARQARDVLKGFGYVRGLRRWHFYGDPTCPACGYRRRQKGDQDFVEWLGLLDGWLPEPDAQHTTGFTCPVCGAVTEWREIDMTYSPHLYVFIDAGELPKDQLELVKQALRTSVDPAPYIVNYGFAPTPGQILNRIRYATRATFRAWEWDPLLAMAFKDFRNTSWWGKGEWNRPVAWTLDQLPPKDAKELEGLLAISKGLCPVCGGKLKWTGKIQSVAEVVIDRELGGGFILLMVGPGPPRALRP